MAKVSVASRSTKPGLANPGDEDFASYFSIIRDKFPAEHGSSAPSHRSVRISLGMKKNDEGEIGIFAAEKYFSGRMDEGAEKQPIAKDVEAPTPVAKSRLATGSTTCSESSGNSQSSFLRRRTPSPREYQFKRKGFLGVFRCPCSGKSMVDDDGASAEDSNSINSKKTGSNPDKVGSVRADEMDSGSRRGEENSFPRSSSLVGGVIVAKEFGSPFSVRAEHVGSSRRKSLAITGGGREDDVKSESSSELFEIESLSINSHPFFNPERREARAACYEPSEASIEWSVITASAANFSVASEYNHRGEEEKKKRQSRPGFLLGCVSEKSVEAKAGGYRREGTSRAEEGSLTPVARYYAESCRAVRVESDPAVGRIMAPY